MTLHISAAELRRIDQQIKLSDRTPRDPYSFNCMMCGRSGTKDGADLQLSMEEARAKRAQVCATCGGKMLLTRADITSTGGSIDPSAPSRLTTRPGYKAAL